MPAARFPLMLTTLPPTEKTAKPAWLHTDDSACKQRGRQLAPGVFEFKEKRKCRGQVRATIYLADYNEERRNDFASTFYGSLAGLKKECEDDWQFILAECIFEQLSL